MMMKGILLFSLIQSLLFKPFRAKTGHISSCPLHTGTPHLAGAVPREKNFILLDSQSCWH